MFGQQRLEHSLVFSIVSLVNKVFFSFICFRDNEENYQNLTHFLLKNYYILLIVFEIKVESAQL